MKDQSKTKQALIQEMSLFGQKIAELEQSESDRKRAEEALRLSEENFRRSLDESPLGVRIVTIEGETIYANQAMLNIYRYDSIEELRSTPLKERYTPGSYAEFQIRKEKRGKGEYDPFEYEISIVRKNGEVRHLQVFRKEILWNGERQFQTIYQDITARKLSEDNLRSSNLEKEILLREVHHRVKNNMQVISGLLDLQASSSKNPELIAMFHESQSRIQAMSLVHEKLYGSKDFARIDLAGYVRALSQELFQSHKINPGEIALIIQSDGDVYVDINKAIPCGLILNELISNALKHAFPRDRHGELQIIIRETKNTEIEMVVRDNGLGLPDDVDIHQPRSAGLHLVNGLVKNQLDGQMEVRRDAGTEIRIKFPL
jgi:PAS domain S-box-containing protein